MGEEQPEQAAIAAAQFAWLGMFVSIPVVTVGVVFAEDLLMIMGASAELARYGRFIS